MHIFWLVCALAIGSVAGALLLMERKIRRRHLRIRTVESAHLHLVASPGQIVFEELAMRHVGTRFADQMPLRLPDAAPGDVFVFCAEKVLFIGPRFAIELAEIEDAAIVAGTLRLRWRRSGELLETSLQAPLHDLERLRREIHVRQPQVLEKLLEMVQPK